MQPRKIDRQRATRIVVIFSEPSDSNTFDLFILNYSRNSKKKKFIEGGKRRTERV